MNKRIWLLLLFLLVGSMLSATSCVTVKQQQITKDQELSDREKIISKAREIENLKPKPFYGKSIPLKNPITNETVWHTMDCSGFVLAVYEQANISLLEKQAGKIEGENGVKIIYNALEKSKKIYRKKIPQVADIVFFNNTWDSNGDKKINDELTHVGIVLSVDENRTVTFIHSARRGGVRLDCVNLYYPNIEKLKGVMINSKIRPRENTDPPDTKYLAGELFNAFGTVFDVPQEGDD